MVKEQCPDATIANMPVDGDGGCWCQYGYNPTPDNGGYMSCVLATAGTPAPQPALVRQRARRLSRQGTCQGTGCHYDFGYQWSTTECEPGDANYQEECESTTTAQVVWYQAGANMDYNGMKASCGEELCTYDQLCPGGEPYTSPVGGQQADHDMWAPILPGPGEGTQNWVQVGTRASGGVALHTAV